MTKSISFNLFWTVLLAYESVARTDSSCVEYLKQTQAILILVFIIHIIGLWDYMFRGYTHSVVSFTKTNNAEHWLVFSFLLVWTSYWNCHIASDMIRRGTHVTSLWWCCQVPSPVIYYRCELFVTPVDGEASGTFSAIVWWELPRESGVAYVTSCLITSTETVCTCLEALSKGWTGDCSYNYCHQMSKISKLY